MKKGILLYKKNLLYFLKRNKNIIFLSILSSALVSIILFFITKIPFYLFTFFPPIILVAFKSKRFSKLTDLSKFGLIFIFSLIFIYIFSILTGMFISKGLSFSLIIFFYFSIFTGISILIYFLFYYFLNKDYLFLSFAVLLSFLASILANSIIISLIVFSVSIFLFSIFYYYNLSKANKRKNLKFLFLFIILILAIGSFFFVQLTTEKEQANLLVESLFKFNFNDQVNLKTDYKFKSILLFIAKIEKSKLLKAVSYPEFSREKGFYYSKRDLPFPSILQNQVWEDESYIKGERESEQITVYNLNLAEGVVFGPNEPYKIVPYMKVDGSKFSSIFSTYSKSISNIEQILDEIDFSSNSLSTEDYLRYTDVGKKDPQIMDLIERYKDYYQDRKDFIIFFYNYFKKNFYYSISTFQKEGYEGIISFLFKTRKGYCAHFASAYALLLRYYGIPARVVGGFKAIEDNKILDYYRFYDFNAHSWVEVYTDKLGWVPIDPTSDRISEDEMLPFEKPIDQDESALLEEILKIEKQLIPQKGRIENKNEKTENNKKIDFKYLVYLSIFIFIISMIFLLKNQIVILLSLIFPSLLPKSLKIYIKKIAKILKQDFITGQQLKVYNIKNYKYILDFVEIYNVIMFAPEIQKKQYLNKKTSKKAFKSYIVIIKELLKFNKLKNL
ncbi:MAG TPA: transglutaminase domain-containing protein [Exilispira sp.]|nr:transglutaminase domain-containing protein [Exilispira sp.]